MKTGPFAAAYPYHMQIRLFTLNSVFLIKKAKNSRNQLPWSEHETPLSVHCEGCGCYKAAHGNIIDSGLASRPDRWRPSCYKHGSPFAVIHNAGF
jgi:hypothetical protein